MTCAHLGRLEHRMAELAQAHATLRELSRRARRTGPAGCAGDGILPHPRRRGRPAVTHPRQPL